MAKKNKTKWGEKCPDGTCFQNRDVPTPKSKSGIPAEQKSSGEPSLNVYKEK